MGNRFRDAWSSILFAASSQQVSFPQITLPGGSTDTHGVPILLLPITSKTPGLSREEATYAESPPEHQRVSKQMGTDPGALCTAPVGQGSCRGCESPLETELEMLSYSGPKYLASVNILLPKSGELTHSVTLQDPSVEQGPFPCSGSVCIVFQGGWSLRCAACTPPPAFKGGTFTF